MTPFWRRWLPRREWDEELQSHLEMRTKWNQQHLGLTPEQGAELARHQFGGALQIREAIEDLYPGRLMADFLQDLRHVVRLVRSSPGVAVMVVTTIAAGIAAATTVFSIVDPLLFRSLPFRNDKQLVSVGVYAPIDNDEFAMGGMYIQWRDHQTVFSSLTAMRPGTQCDLQLAQTERVPCAAVQQNFLSTLGVATVIGGNFTGPEDRPNAPRTMLISDRIWRGYFGSQPNVVGRVVKLDDGWTRIIGVLPSDFVLPQGSDVDVLLAAQLDERVLHDPASTVFLRAFARLKPGVSIEQATHRMRSLFNTSIQTTVPAEVRREVRPVIRSVRDRIVQDAKLASRMLLGAVALLLLMTCLAVTNLLLARAHAKRNETAMRAALGASRNRLVRQSLTETLLLALAGGVTGFLLSWACIRLLVHAAPGGFLELQKAHADMRALLFSGAATILATVMSGLLPALRTPESSGLVNWRITPSGTAQLRQVLTSLQLACSLVLLTGALMFVRSLSRLESQQPGFSENHLTAISLRLPRGHYATPQRRIGFDDQLAASLRALPGIESVALSDSIPPAGSALARPLSNIKVAGRPPLTGATGMVVLRYVTPDYFRTLQIAILRGRTFTDAEQHQAERSVVVSESLARRLFPSGDAVGGQVSLNGGTSWVSIIGMVSDVKNNGMTVPASPEYYLLRNTRDVSAPQNQRVGLTTVAFVRSNLDIATLSHWFQREISAIDPAVTVSYQGMPERLHHLSDRPRFMTLVLLIFAGVSVLLAAGGLYGVVAFLVSSRTREIGVRAALGATRRDILLMVQRQTLVYAGTGIVAGVCGSWALAGLVRALLFETSPHDPVVLGSGALCLFTVTLLAALRPSWNATRVDPGRALRVD
jgi:predicted permease